MMPLATVIWHSFYFWLFSLLACAFAMAVVLTNNVVRMAFYLTLCLGATSGLFFLAGSEFVGAMQLMIYVGGTLVLLIFGVMLTAQESFVSMKTKGGEWILAAILGGSLLLLLVQSAFSVKDWNTPNPHRGEIALTDARDTVRIGMGLVGPRVDDPHSPSYLLLFELASVHLLVVLVGAAYLARAKVRVSPQALVATSERSRGRLNTAAWLWLALGIVGNLVGAATLLLQFPPLPEPVVAHFSNTPGWLLTVLGVACLVNVVLLLVVGSWQKWGYFALYIVVAVQAVAMWKASVAWWCVAAFVPAAMLPAVVLYGLLQFGRPRSNWTQME